MDIGPDVGLWSYLLLVPENPREPRQWTEEVGRMGNKEPSQLVPPTPSLVFPVKAHLQSTAGSLRCQNEGGPSPRRVPCRPGFLQTPLANRARGCLTR